MDARWSGRSTAGSLCCLGYAYTCTPYLVSDVCRTTVRAIGWRSYTGWSNFNIPSLLVWVVARGLLVVVCSRVHCWPIRATSHWSQGGVCRQSVLLPGRSMGGWVSKQPGSPRSIGCVTLRLLDTAHQQVGACKWKCRLRIPLAAEGFLGRRIHTTSHRHRQQWASSVCQGTDDGFWCSYFPNCEKIFVETKPRFKTR